jgi:S-DNA-T family DNA segregation ATPase FtsK/SpoIIIE
LAKEVKSKKNEKVKNPKKTIKNKINKKPNKKSNKKKKQEKNIIVYEIKLICLFAVTVLMILSLHTDSVGIIGKYINSISKGLFSKAAYVFPYFMFSIIFVKLNKNFEDSKLRVISALFILFFAILLFMSVPVYDFFGDVIKSKNISFLSLDGVKESFGSGVEIRGGGVVGNLLTDLLYNLIGKLGIYLVIIVSIISSVLLLTNYSLKSGFNVIKKTTANFSDSYEKKRVQSKIHVSNRTISNIKKESIRGIKKGYRVSSLNEEAVKDEKNIEINDYVDNHAEVEENKLVDFKIDDKKDISTVKKSVKLKIDSESSEKMEEELEQNSHIQFPDYVLPRLNLLDKTKNQKRVNHIEYRENADILFKTLKNFNVDGKIISITNGPSLTRYEFQPAPGIKVSKIKSLSDDIALKLAVPRVRIAPIPNKAAIGIEVPNKETNIVQIRQVLNTQEFKEKNNKLNVVLGKSISGKTVIADLAGMPHLLIAGATGSGKSVCVNIIITSILFSKTPDEVKFLMIDPKVVELSHYNGIPHLVLPVVTDPQKAAIALNWVVKEMEERYDKFAKSFTRDLESYNNKFPDKKLAQIVVVIDELADLMMVAPKQVENSIARIAQKARAAGIHLIVATQRPSVDVITGLIKANIPSRISFAVASAVDSRTILDEGGAEKLLGKGDMLYKPVGAPKPIRLQGAFISDSEVFKTTEFIKKQIDPEKINYRNEIIEEKVIVNSDEEVDEYLEQAIEIVVDSQKGSISFLQRKMRIGYNRAARMIDAMEERNIVGPSNGSKPREVFVGKDEISKLEV